MATIPAPGAIAPGRLVVFSRDDFGDQLSLGVIASREGKRGYMAKDAAGRLASVASQEVRYLLPTDGSASAEDTVADFEAALRKVLETEAEAAPQPLLDAWEKLLADGRAVYEGASPEEIASLAFGDDSPLSCYMAYSLLESQHGRLHFTPARAGKYKARPRAMVQELRQRKQEAADEANAMESVAAAVQKGLRSYKSKAPPAAPLLDVQALPLPQLAIVQSLQDLSNHCMDKASDTPGPPQPLAADLLRRLGRLPTASNAFKLCLQLGIVHPHENLFLRGSAFARPFLPEALEQAERIVAGETPPDEDAATRRDLRHLKAYAVDSADTREVDDAISLEVLEDGRERIWVHIADATRWIAEGSPLYRDAMVRQTSLYLPDALVTMLPLPLAETLLSLRSGVDTCALSLAVELADDGSIASAELTPSLVRVTYRLKYEELDDMLYEGVGDREEEALGRLSRLAEVRLRRRSSHGAVDRFQPRPPQFVAKAKKNADAEGGYAVDVFPEDPNKRSTQLVTEMMVLAGEAVARIAASAGLAVPFRRQAPPSHAPADVLLEQFPERYCRAQAACRFMMPAELSAEPGPHSGLGLDGYVQWTSPIRRFNDLLTHYQLKKYLRASNANAAAAASGPAAVVLPASEMLQRAKTGEGAVAAASRVTRSSARYWLIERLRRGMAEEAEYEGYIVGMHDKREKGGKVVYSVVLTELGATLTLAEPNASALNLGETVLVRVTNANPRAMIVALAWRERDGQVGSHSDKRQSELP